MKKSIKLTISAATMIALAALVTKYEIGDGRFCLIFYPVSISVLAYDQVGL